MFDKGYKIPYSEEYIKAAYLCHRSEKHQNSMCLYTDGSKTTSSAGYAVVDGNHVVKSVRMPPEASIYTCELSAIKDALIYAIQRNPRRIMIASDSLSSLQALEDLQSSQPIITEIQCKLYNLQQKGNDVQLCWVPSHVGVRGNELADKAAVAATTSEPQTRTALSHRDYYPYIKKKIKKKWEDNWRVVTGNKLREVKATVNPWRTSYNTNRIHEVSLCRLRIGHTLYTHQHLMERRPQPICETCAEPLTVKHLFTTCTEFLEQRTRVFGQGAITLPAILEETPSFNCDKIFVFLRNIGIFNKI